MSPTTIATTPEASIKRVIQTSPDRLARLPMLKPKAPIATTEATR